MTLNILAEILVITGACGLLYALILVFQLMKKLPKGGMNRRWNILKILIILFFAGYLFYGVNQWGKEMLPLDLMVPAIFFFGSIFVLLTINLSLLTAEDLQRVVLLEQDNITDPLMGIFNRRYMDRRLVEEYERSVRYDSPLSLLLIDLDHFKVINDSYGHQTGDHVLKNIGTLLLQMIRPSDIAVRYGGEEIVLITPNTSISSATMIAERIRKNIETHDFFAHNNSESATGIQVTASIGLAYRESADTDSQILVERADQALYQAKQQGRNRTVVSKAKKTCSFNGDKGLIEQHGIHS